MKKIMPVIWVAAGSALVMGGLGPWLFEGAGLMLSALILSGVAMAAVQRETAVVRYLDKLIIGSAAFGILTVLFFTVRAQAEAYFREGRSFSLASLGERDTLFMAGAIAFTCLLGGLIGVVLKGFYALYKGRLDAVIVFAGPLFAMAASLVVFKLKVGGTVLSALHGWPYPLLTHRIKDVLDGFAIDEWIFSPGSMYHYVIYNYLWYCALFLLVFHATSLMPKRLKASRTLVLFGCLALTTAGLVSYLPLKRGYIARALSGAGYCRADADCVIVANRAPFSCAIVANRGNAERITRLVNSYPSTEQLYCSGDERATCVYNRCQISFDY